MRKFDSPLNNLKVASPCSANWNEMIGSERQRHCGDCQLNVYNLSGMTRTEAENFLINAEGRVCVRFFRRADGTVLTADCPVGWQAVKRRFSKMATAFASLIFAVLSGIGVSNYFAKATVQTTMGQMMPVIEKPTMEPVIKKPIMGEVAINDNSNIETPNVEIMGGIESQEYEMGKMAIVDQVKSPKIKKHRR